MARNSNSFLVAVSTLLIGSVMIQTCESSIKIPLPFRKFHVQVENGLKNETLNTHCQSKDDDLGIHVLPPGSKFEWGFHSNFFGTTLFFCNVWWNLGHKSFEVFKVNDKFIYNFCGGQTCQWRATEDGVQIFHSKTGTWDLKYTWEK